MNLDKNHLPGRIKNVELSKAAWNKTEDFLQENVTWKRALDYYIQENSFLKTRLSEVVDKKTDQLFIAHAEQFQNEFILKDECMLDIRNDLKGQEKDLRQAFSQKKEPDQKVCKMQEKLRNEMSYLEKQYAILENKFNKYLLSFA